MPDIANYESLNNNTVEQHQVNVATQTTTEQPQARAAGATTIDKIKPNKYMLSNLKEPLTKHNWSDWTRRIILILDICDLWEYVNGNICKPNHRIDRTGAKNWHSNNKLAKVLVLQNISKSQLQHIKQQDQSAAEIWKTIMSLYQATGFRTTLTYMKKLYTMQAEDDENIPEYINKMKAIIEDINAIDDPDLEINSKTFKGVLLQSLPASWDQFVDSLHHTRIAGGDPAPSLNIVHLMRILKDKYYCRVGRKDITKEESNVTTAYKTSLAKCISNKDRSKLYCKCCKKCNHTTDNCRHLGKPKCTNCGRFGHMTETCWHDGSTKRKCKSNKTQSMHDDSNP